jgi:hypothetical protein
MAERRTSYGLPELLASGNGDLLGVGRAQLPLPPLLMFERIETISDTGGAHGRGQVVATPDVAGNPSLDWLFFCHFRDDPVMPGSCAGSSSRLPMVVKADGEIVCAATDVTVGLAELGAPSDPPRQPGISY